MHHGSLCVRGKSTRLTATLQAKLRSENTDRMRVRIAGHRGSGRRTFAAVVSSRLGLPLLAIDADAVDDAHWHQVFCRAQRQAYLQRCVPAWVGESLLRRSWPADVLAFPLQFVICEGHADLLPARDIVELPGRDAKSPHRGSERRLAPVCTGLMVERADSIVGRAISSGRRRHR